MDGETPTGPHPMRETYRPLGGTRSQAVQRLQIGLSGLGAMLLLIGLAAVVSDRAQESEDLAVPEAVPTITPDEPAHEPARDPLADAGVVPDLPASPAPTPSGGTAQGTRNAPPPATVRP